MPAHYTPFAGAAHINEPFPITDRLKHEFLRAEIADRMAEAESISARKATAKESKFYP